jgi:hypothetical protein
VNDTVRGVIVFVTVLLTIGIWAPLRNQPVRLPTGAVLTETYFGVFRYLTLRTETKEPNFKMEWLPNYKRLGGTAAATTVLWVGVFALVRKKPAKGTELPSK